MWIKYKGASYQIISANIHEQGENTSVWVGRPTGQSLKVFESNNKEEAQEVLDAINFALEQSIPVLEL